VNPAAPPPGTRLCDLSELPEAGARRFDFRSDEDMFSAFVVRKGDQVVGYVDYCPHNGWPLAAVEDRYLTKEKDLILCAAHGALFRIEDGFCIAGPCADASLIPWPVKVEGGAVFTAEAKPPPPKGRGIFSFLGRKR